MSDTPRTAATVASCHRCGVIVPASMATLAENLERELAAARLSLSDGTGLLREVHAIFAPKPTAIGGLCRWCQTYQMKHRDDCIIPRIEAATGNAVPSVSTQTAGGIGSAQTPGTTSWICQCGAEIANCLPQCCFCFKARPCTSQGNSK